MFGKTTFSAQARFEDGVATVKVIARTPYGQRQSTISHEVEDEKMSAAFGNLFEKAIKAVRDDLQQEAAMQTARDVVAAANNNEVI